MKTREYFIGQQYFGSGPAPQEFVHNEVHQPIGQAFFCPICAEVWATATVQGAPTQVRHRFCGKHNSLEAREKANGARNCSSLGRINSSEICGSLWLDESRTWNDNLPPAVVARELRLTLEWALHASVLHPGIASTCKDMVEFIQQSQRKQK